LLNGRINMKEQKETKRFIDITDQIEFYNSFWLDRQHVTNIGPSSRHARRNILKMLKKITFNSLLDVGCGEGSLLKDIEQMFPNVRLYGIDVSREALKLASAKVKATFIAINLENDFVVCQVDVTVCSEVLEHIEDDLGLLEKIRENTRYLAISVPSGKIDHIDVEVGHRRRYSKDELRSKLEQVGYRVLYMRNWGFPFYSPLYRAIFKNVPESMRTGTVHFYEKWISFIIYQLFKLNIWDKGDRLFAIAERS
jgi:SAM-dependent methyltransferase